MTKKPEDLEQKVDLILENLGLRKRLSKLEKSADSWRIAYTLIKSLEIKDYNTVITDANRFLEENQANFYALYCRGLAFLRQNNYDKALEDFTKAIDIAPFATFYLKRGITLACKENWEMAIQDYRKAEELEPSAEAYFREGRAWQEIGSLKNAVKCYGTVLQLEPRKSLSNGNYFPEDLKYRELAEQQIQHISHKRKKRSKRWILGACFLSVGIGAYLKLSNSDEAAPEAARVVAEQADSEQREVATGPALMTALGRLLAAEFEEPFEIKIQREDRNGIERNDGSFVAYVYDSATTYVHRFANEGEYIGKYTIDGAKNTAAFVERPSFILFHSGKVIVNNYDRTITTYSLPTLNFVQRELGTLLPEEAYLKPTIRRNIRVGYTLLNDAPSRFEVDFNLVIQLAGWSGNRNIQGRCYYLPILAFNNQERTIIGGYSCDIMNENLDKDFEQHVRIPYESVRVTENTVGNIIDTAIYTDSMGPGEVRYASRSYPPDSLFLIERGQKKIKMIKLDF